jgi:site-specific DNA-methyltransferase (adenine-specific)
MLGDCLERMKEIPDKSVDMVLTDPPYGTTQNKWDSVVTLSVLWEEIGRISKDSAAILLFGMEPFSSSLRLSNLKMFRYDWIWEKTKAGQFLNAKRKPLEAHEVVSVFYKNFPKYTPQMGQGKPYIKKAVTDGDGDCYGKFQRTGSVNSNKGTRFPRTVLKFSNPNNNSLHPTQKPVDLLEYLVKTYTLENETVLDFTMGSGSTGVACKNLNRNFIGIERDEKYFDIAKNRIENA